MLLFADVLSFLLSRSIDGPSYYRRELWRDAEVDMGSNKLPVKYSLPSLLLRLATDACLLCLGDQVDLDRLPTAVWSILGYFRQKGTSLLISRIDAEAHALQVLVGFDQYTLLFALSIFVVGSLGSALSQTMIQLIVTRAISGMVRPTQLISSCLLTLTFCF